MSEFGILASASAGMDAERAALDLAARNVAVAETTGKPGAFERMVPRFAVASAASDVPDLAVAADLGDATSGGAGDVPDPDDDAAAPPIRYLGATPQRGTDVDAVTEMVAVLDAQRAYEQNASIFDVGKRLAERTIDMGRLS